MYKCFKIIHQGPQDIVIFHIQMKTNSPLISPNQNVFVNGDKFSMLFLLNLTTQQSNSLILNFDEHTTFGP